MHKVYSFVGAGSGAWRILRISARCGEGLPEADFLDVRPTEESRPSSSHAWLLQGLASNIRYATRAELDALRSVQEPLGRPQARLAALIPIRKSDAWWALAQDERRAIFEEQSRHTEIGLRYLPAVARQLYHARDLAQPFDFLTWFEYAPESAAAFEDLVAHLRSTYEWTYVDREVDIRLERHEPIRNEQHR